MTAAVVGHLWHSTAFAALAALLTLTLRRNRAAVRFWVWFGASVKFLVPFGFLIEWGSRIQWHAAVAERVVTPAVAYVAATIAEPLPAAAAAARDWRPIALAAVWAAGTALVVAMRIRGWLRMRAAVRASTRMEMATGVEVRCSRGSIEPGVVGFRRPVLLLPRGMAERLTAAQLQAVLAHELCHVRRRDNLLALAHMAVEAAIWFYPLVWWIGARLIEERERACDEAVLGLGSDPRVYADAILGVCKFYVESPLACVPGVTGANLKRRIEAIMKNTGAMRLSRAKRVLLGAAAACAVAAPVGIGLIGAAGSLPVLRAAPPVFVTENADAAPQRPAPVLQTGGHLSALLLDLGGTTAEQEAQARAKALDFAQNGLPPGDRAAVITTVNGRPRILQDFTGDRGALEAAILKATSAAAVGPANPEAVNETARLLSGLTEKPGIVCFGNCDASSVAVAQDRAAEAAAKFGSTNSPMARTYIRYGAPDRIDNRGAGDEIWHYNYLDNFHGSAEIEFTAGPGLPKWASEHILNLPVGQFQGTPRVAQALVDALLREHHPQISAILMPIPGLPVRDAWIDTYPAGEPQVLFVPTDSMSGRVDILAQIKDASGRMIAAVRDKLMLRQPVGVGFYRDQFVLAAGSYVCDLIERDGASGQFYGETIAFEVR